MKTALPATAALLAFALNSVLCRLALEREAMGAADFTALRLLSGAALLVVASSFAGRRGASARFVTRWQSALWLLLYALPFAYAYVELSVGTGALVLFGAVQTTMIIGGLLGGERPRPLAWCGLAVALAGLAWLVSPGLERPSLRGFVLMGVAGFAWGVYSLRGRGTRNPLADTQWSFLLAAPLALLVAAITWRPSEVSFTGIGLAILSGAVASGLGYVAWYAALRGLTATRAATVQLAVPVLASLLGVIVLGESISTRLVLSGALILGGIGLAVWSRVPRAIPTTAPSTPRGRG